METSNKSIHQRQSGYDFRYFNDHKIFPLHFWTSFHRFESIPDAPFTRTLDVLKCDYCGYVHETNWSGYYCGYVVFTAPGVESFACRKKCLPRGSMDWANQQHGHHKPMTLGKYKDSIPHLMVSRLFFYESTWYQLWNINRFEWREKEKIGYNEACGGTFEKGQIHYNSGKMVYTIGENVIKVLTISDIVNVVNDIIIENRFKQLTLF